MIKQSLKILTLILSGILAFTLLYILAVLGISRISVNSDVRNNREGVEIFLISNGVHTDIAVPVQNEIKDWRDEVRFSQTKANDSLAKYVSFGWGDKEFYLNTPEWSDLKFSTAFKAAFNLGTSAMHTRFYRNLSESADCRRIIVSNEDYQKLVHFISDSFYLNNQNEVKWIAGHSYGKYDAFYEAKGSYNLFYTCNTWTNQALKSSNQKAALWTVYDKGILYHYD
ncbi:TIGR02117 family protein [Flavobacterium limnosediminis]|uniref:TIGR02117 family protein n=1 Tax=Flavobacterium limnosediminis TaxID=1401027 RepID=UPI0006878CE5